MLMCRKPKSLAGHLAAYGCLSRWRRCRVSRNTRPMKCPMRGRQSGHQSTPAFARERAVRPPTPAIVLWPASGLAGHDFVCGRRPPRCRLDKTQDGARRADRCLAGGACGPKEHGPRFSLVARPCVRHSRGRVVRFGLHHGVLDGELLWAHEVVDVWARGRVRRAGSVLLWHTMTALRTGLVGCSWGANGSK
jgi:hypothetical protein